MRFTITLFAILLLPAIAVAQSNPAIGETKPPALRSFEAKHLSGQALSFVETELSLKFPDIAFSRQGSKIVFRADTDNEQKVLEELRKHDTETQAKVWQAYLKREQSTESAESMFDDAGSDFGGVQDDMDFEESEHGGEIAFGEELTEIKRNESDVAEALKQSESIELILDGSRKAWIELTAEKPKAQLSDEDRDRLAGMIVDSIGDGTIHLQGGYIGNPGTLRLSFTKDGWRGGGVAVPGLIRKLIDQAGKREAARVARLRESLWQKHAGDEVAQSDEPEPAVSIDELQEQYEQAEREAAKVAEKMRSIDLVAEGANRIVYGQENDRERHGRLKQELSNLVRGAFDLRMQIQRERLRQAEADLRVARERIDQRQRIADEIIDRRVSELESGEDTSWLGKSDNRQGQGAGSQFSQKKELKQTSPATLDLQPQPMETNGDRTLQAIAAKRGQLVALRKLLRSDEWQRIERLSKAMQGMDAERLIVPDLTDVPVIEDAYKKGVSGLDLANFAIEEMASENELLEDLIKAVVGEDAKSLPTYSLINTIKAVELQLEVAEHQLNVSQPGSSDGALIRKLAELNLADSRVEFERAKTEFDLAQKKHEIGEGQLEEVTRAKAALEKARIELQRREAIFEAEKGDEPATSSFATASTGQVLTLTTVAEVETHIRELLKQRELLENYEVRYQVNASGETPGRKTVRVYRDGPRGRYDEKPVGQPTVTEILTDEYAFSVDPSSEQSNYSTGEGRGIWGTIPDLRRLGLVVWWVDSFDTHPIGEQLLPDDRRDLTVETVEKDGRTVTVVKYECDNPKLARVWCEYWLDPAQGNFPVFIRTSSREHDDPKPATFVREQTVQWHQYNGVWFPTEIEFDYKIDKVKSSAPQHWHFVLDVQFARFNQDPFPDVFEPLDLEKADRSTKLVD